jgi:2-polyprenyl-6-hydroxyphenyl methylase/3-demethylubiquinone-9 3-methyltransferase
MSALLQAACPRQARCKCCGADSYLYGVVDFHKNCEIYRRRVLDLSGVPIYYHRCPVCRFIFTTAFDAFTSEDFRRHVYNDDYLLVDPDYREDRPRNNAAVLSSLFPDAKPSAILDYGGGQGVLAELLTASGFPHVETYDPFVPRHSTRPADRFDCIVCFEVAEHSTDPRALFADLSQLLADPGLIVFSTLVQPADIDQQGLNWWYAGPRNGHVSLFSIPSIERIVHPMGFFLGSFNEGTHVLFREIPAFARHFIRA